MTTREESLAAFIRQVRAVVADAWPEGGTMYITPCEKKETAHSVQEPSWPPSLSFSIQAPAAQPVPQPDQPASEQFQQAQLF